MTLVVGVLLASLLGSVHCAAMCGAFTCLYRPTAAAGEWRAHAAYNAGRLASYVTLGAIAGSVGSGVNHLQRISNVVTPAAALAGILMIVWAAAAIGATLGVRVPVTLAPRWAQRVLGRALLAARDSSAVLRASLLGLLTTLLPCGWLYTFVVVAGGTGSALAGSAVMVAFWAGTLPMMIGVALGAARLLGPLQRRLPIVSAALVLVLGVLSLAGKLRAPAVIDHEHSSMVHVGR